MKKLCLIFLLFVIFMDNLKSEVVDIPMRIKISGHCVDISCTDFNFGKLIPRENGEIINIDGDGNLFNNSGTTVDNLTGVTPSSCIIDMSRCYGNVPFVPIKIQNLPNGGVLYGSIDSENFLKLDIGSGWTNKECYVDRIGVTSYWNTSVVQKLCGVLEYKGNIPKGNYSTNFSIYLQY